MSRKLRLISASFFLALSAAFLSVSIFRNADALDMRALGSVIGTTVNGGTSGSVLFVNSSNQLAQDNANFSYSGTQLTISTVSSPPGVRFKILDNANVSFPNQITGNAQFQGTSSNGWTLDTQGNTSNFLSIVSGLSNQNAGINFRSGAGDTNGANFSWQSANNYLLLDKPLYVSTLNATTVLQSNGNRVYTIIGSSVIFSTSNVTATTAVYSEILSTTYTVLNATSKIKVSGGANIRVTNGVSGFCAADIAVLCAGTTVQWILDAVDSNVPSNFVTSTVPLLADYTPGSTGAKNCRLIIANDSGNGTVSFNPSSSGFNQSQIRMEEIFQ